MYKLKVITTTVREGRKGISVAQWVMDYLKDNPDFEIELLDLKEIDLPLMNEPNHPRLQQYTHDYTRRWSEMIHPADAFIFVLAEYNYSFPAPIKNAIDYLFNEWRYKPVAFVSYGGVSGGLRSSQHLKSVVTTVGMMPLADQVNIPFFATKIDEGGVFHPDEHITRSMDRMMSELKKWTLALKSMRDTD